MKKIQWNYSVYLVFLMALAILLINNGLSLWDQDESAYAGFGRRMMESGDWLIPEYPWSDVHRKPPFHFWNITALFSLFGQSEFVLRLSSVCYIMGVYFLMYFGLRGIYGEKKTLIGVAVLASSFLVPSLAKVAVTDATLLFFSTLCAVAVIRVMNGDRWKWVLLFWLGFALALLTKGPPVIIFTGGLAALIFILHPKRLRLLRFHPWFGLPLACLPLYFWGKATVSVDGGAFVSWMYDWYILKRISGSVFGQTGPPGTHLLGMTAFFFPFVVFVPAIIKRVFQSFLKEKEHFFLIAAWFVAGWLVYEFSASKLPAYVIVAHVPLSLLIAEQILIWEEKKFFDNKVWRYLQSTVTVLFFGTLIVLPFVVDLLTILKWPLLIIGLVFLLLHLWNLWRAKGFNLWGFLILSMGFNLAAWTFAYPAADQFKGNTKVLAEQLGEQLVAETTVYIGNSAGRPPSLFFYLESYFEDVYEEYDTEKMLRYYSSAEPAAFILTEKQLKKMEAKVGALQFYEIEAALSDRKAPSVYFITYNSSALKGT